MTETKNGVMPFNSPQAFNQWKLDQSDRMAPSIAALDTAMSVSELMWGKNGGLVAMQTPEVRQRYTARMQALNDAIQESNADKVIELVPIIIKALTWMNNEATRMGYIPANNEVVQNAIVKALLESFPGATVEIAN